MRVAIGKIADRGLGRGLRIDRGLAFLDARDEPRGFLADPVGRDLAVPAHGHPFGLPSDTGLGHVHFASQWIDAHTEVRQPAVLEDRILAVDREAVHDSLREGEVLAFGYVVVRR